MTILHVDSSINGDRSVSRALTAATVAHLAALTPSAKVVYRDLGATPLPHLAQIGAGDAGALDEFLSADTVVIGAPMYNFGVPSQLKVWLDHIAVPGKTFRYGANGPEGLCARQRVVIVSSRGGIFTAPRPMRASTIRNPISRLSSAFWACGTSASSARKGSPSAKRCSRRRSPPLGRTSRSSRPDRERAA